MVSHRECGLVLCELPRISKWAGRSLDAEQRFRASPDAEILLALHDRSRFHRQVMCEKTGVPHD
jgi:hypothetical protein